MRKSIERLAARIEDHPTLKKDQKEELLALLAEIEAEVEAGDDEEGGADSVKAALQLTSSGAEEQSLPDQLEDSLNKLGANYPKTAAALGRIASVLSRMGI